jgi:hypothetical protein
MLTTFAQHTKRIGLRRCKNMQRRCSIEKGKAKPNYDIQNEGKGKNAGTTQPRKQNARTNKPETARETLVDIYNKGMMMMMDDNNQEPHGRHWWSISRRKERSSEQLLLELLTIFFIVTMDALVINADPVLTKQTFGTVRKTSIRINLDVISSSWMRLL